MPSRRPAAEGRGLGHLGSSFTLFVTNFVALWSHPCFGLYKNKNKKSESVFSWISAFLTPVLLGDNIAPVFLHFPGKAWASTGGNQTIIGTKKRWKELWLSPFYGLCVFHKLSASLIMVILALLDSFSSYPSSACLPPLGSHRIQWWRFH